MYCIFNLHKTIYPKIESFKKMLQMSGYFLTFLLGVMPLTASHFNITTVSGGKISENYPFQLTKSLSKSAQIWDEPQHQNYRLRRVCLDAGHGGHDPGCVSGKLREKENTLSMTLKLGKLIEENFSSVEVIYTRELDEFVDLRERAAIANRAKADLFISIHCNSTDEQSGAYGTETYTVGTHKLASSFEVSKRENASMLLEKDYEEKYDGFEPTSDEAYILFSYLHNVHLEKSKKLAQFVENEMVTTAKRKSLGVKQAGFWVLHATAMPSVLIETGFLNHPVEGKFISSEDGQNKIVAAIFEAFKRYKNAVEGNSENPQNNKNTKEKLTEKNAEKIPTPTNDAPKVYLIKGEERGAKSARQAVIGEASVEKGTPKTVKKEIAIKDIPKPTLVKNAVSVAKPVAKTPPPIPKVVAETKPNHGKIEQGIIYKILIFNTKIAINEKDRKAGKWQGLEVEILREKGEFWYLVGNTPQAQNAKALCSKLKNKGFAAAKVLKFKNGKLLP